jgi:PAS domain S-box-containing protein
MPLNVEILWIIVAMTVVILVIAFSLITLVVFNQRRFISIQKEKLREIEIREKKYSDLFNNVTDIVFIHSLDGTIIQISEAVHRLLGFRVEELVGRSLHAILDTMYHSRIESYLLRIGEDGELHGRIRVLDKWGSPHVLEYRNSIEMRNETSVAVRGIARDVTPSWEAERALSENEKQYRRLVEFSPLPMVIHAEGVILYANNSALALVKAENLSKVVGCNVEQFILAGPLNPLEEVIGPSNGSPRQEIHARKLLLPDQSIIDVETVSLPVRYDGKEAVHTVIHDVTEAKRIEETLREIPRQILDAQEKERRKVVSDLHDGVNQLLYSVQIRLQTAEKEKINPALAVSVKDIGRDLNKAIEEIEQITHNLRPKMLDDLGLVSAVRGLCNDFTERTEIPVERALENFSDGSSKAIELCFFRIIQESLSNIEKHADATNVSVTLQDAEGVLIATVKDNGKGFDPNDEKEKSARRKGIGMNTMNERAVYLGGSVSVDSAPDEGTTITVRIPKVVEHTEV